MGFPVLSILFFLESTDHFPIIFNGAKPPMTVKSAVVEDRLCFRNHLEGNDRPIHIA